MYKLKTAIVGLGNVCHGYDDDKLVSSNCNYPTRWSVLKKHPFFQLVAICDIDRRKVDAFRKKITHSVECFDKLSDLLKMPGIDILIIATPSHHHYKDIYTALNYGIPRILCEKPITNNVNHGREINSFLEKTNCFFVVNYFRLFSPMYIDLFKSITEQKIFGDIRGVSARYSNGVINNGTHIISLLYKVLGRVLWVSGYDNNNGHDNNKNDYNIDLHIQFDKSLAYIYGFNNDEIDVFEIDIIFSNGRIVIDRDVVQVFKIDKSQKITGSKEFFIENKITPDPGFCFRNVYNNIAESISLCSAEDAFLVLSVAENGIKSSLNNNERIFI